MNFAGFEKKMYELADQNKHSSLSLEVYLSTLYGKMNESLTPSLETFYRLFAESCDAKPLDFNPAWDKSRICFKSPFDPQFPASYQFCIDVLKFQIADLHYINNGQVIRRADKWRAARPNDQEEADYEWCNGNIESYLESGISGYISHLNLGKGELVVGVDNTEIGKRLCQGMDWFHLGSILVLGGFYE